MSVASPPFPLRSGERRRFLINREHRRGDRQQRDVHNIDDIEARSVRLKRGARWCNLSVRAL